MDHEFKLRLIMSEIKVTKFRNRARLVHHIGAQGLGPRERPILSDLIYSQN